MGWTIRGADTRSKNLSVIFVETKLQGAFLIEPERLNDERGFFARVWCRREFEEHGLNSELAQSSISFNRVKGTLRGIHYQVAPYEEAKLVRCTMGSIYDVMIDLRPQSPSFKQHVGEVLTAKNGRMLYVPEGFAHGFITMEDNCEIFYQISEFYSPQHSRGVRWDDVAFSIKWPLAPTSMSVRDRNYPDFIAP
jgi:dTDP-4-dehydrorhamnose 3,5-epimerase